MASLCLVAESNREKEKEKKKDHFRYLYLFKPTFLQKNTKHINGEYIQTPVIGLLMGTMMHFAVYSDKCSIQIDKYMADIFETISIFVVHIVNGIMITYHYKWGYTDLALPPPQSHIAALTLCVAYPSSQQ